MGIYTRAIQEKIEYDLLWEQYINVINEAYVGKTDTLYEVEKAIGALRRKLNIHKDMNASKEAQTINRLMEKQFGMRCFSLNIYPLKEIDAYTETIACTFDISGIKNFKKYVVADRAYGFRFIKDNNFCLTVNLSFGMIANDRFTDGEILAVILHEVGHNFSDFIDNKIRLANISYIQAYYECILFKCITHPWRIPRYRRELYNDGRLKVAEKKQKRSNPIKAFTTSIKSGIKEFISNIKEIRFKLKESNIEYAEEVNTIIMNNQKAKDAAIRSLDRRDEVIADKFVAIYGYGNEFASSLIKMDIPSGKVYDYLDKKGYQNINDKWEDLTKGLNELDAHPYSVQRILECIKTLEDELKQEEMDPKKKDIIEVQIKELKQTIESACDTKDKDEREAKRALYNAYINDELPDAVTEEIEIEINKELNEIMSKNKK